MKLKSKILAGLIGLLGVVQAPAARGYDNPRAAQWQEDLRYLAQKIREIHPDPFWSTDEATFEAAVEQLGSQIPVMRDYEIVTGLLQVAALIRDGHTGLQLATAGDDWKQQYPVVIYPFEEGVYLASADGAYADYVGGQVMRIGPLDTDSALSLVQTLTNGENEFTRLDRVSRFLTYPSALAALGLATERGTLPLTVRFDDGTERSFEVTALPDSEVTFVGMEMISPGAVSARTPGEAPLHLRDPHRAYWFEHLREENALYVQFNSVRNAGHEPLGAFFDRVLAYADSNDVELLILDIRFNHGGNNQLLQPLIHGLIKRDGTINQPGSFYTVIGRGTFSAAISCTARLEEHTNVRFVGEPAGSGTEHWGDSDEIELPNSRIRVWVSAWTWKYGLPWDRRAYYAPRVPAPPTFASYRAGVDPALAAIRADRDEPSLTDILLHVAADGREGDVENAYFEYKAEHPDYWYTTEAELNNLGYRFMGHQDYRTAALVFRLNAESYPESANCYDSWAEACLEMGDYRRARELYTRALEVDPRFENAARMLREMESAAAHQATDH